MSSRGGAAAGSSIVDDVEPVEQILAERAVARSAREIAVRRGDARARRPSRSLVAPTGAHARRSRARAAASPGARAASRRSRRGRACRRRASAKRPGRSAVAPVNAPRDVTEQLALEQRLGQRRAVDRDERAARAPRSRVDGARATSPLPVPVSPMIEHGTSASRDALDDVEHLAHRRAARRSSLPSREPLAERLAAARAPRAAARPRRARARGRATSSSSLNGFVR